ncbi:MAG: HAMP domain-containing sensor histidine kinase [Myxococcota bacterium]
MPVLPLRAWLALSHLAVLCLPLVVVLLSGALGHDLVQQTREDVEHQADLVAMVLAAEMTLARLDDPEATLQSCADRLSAKLRAAKASTLAGFELTDVSGVVTATSGTQLGQDLSDRREVKIALQGRMGNIIRPRVPRRDMPLWGPGRRARVWVFVAVPIVVEGETLGALVVSRTPREELQALYRMAPRAILAAMGALILTIALAFGAAVLATRSLQTLDASANRIARGDLDGMAALARPELSHVAEVAGVARSVRRAALRLRERIDYIGEFASNVSHEFKTPLATLRGTVELMVDEGAAMPEAQQRRFLDNASREIDRLERLVTGLLALARADQARANEPVDFGEVVRRVGERLDVEVEGEAGWVRGSGVQLETLLENLIRNAREHGGDTVRVRLRGFHEDGGTGVIVADDGRGISAANLPQVFDRFFTTRRDDGGTGLGLALAKAVVVQHGGTIEVHSQPGDTRFVVRLPAV